MEMEQTAEDLRLKNEQLRQENDDLKSIISVVKENQDLRTRMQSFNKDAPEELKGTESFSQWQNTFDEKQFKKDLQQTKSEQRTSSPVDFKSFIQNSVIPNPEGIPEIQCHKTDSSQTVKNHSQVTDPNRLFGEIAYQLDRRILSHVFQGNKRFYGFTLVNIKVKITELSTHPLTGKVDEGYRIHLTQRYNDLLERLSKLGYKEALHPAFSEFIVNSYGILKDRPNECSTQETSYNNPEFLRKVIIAIAPKRLHKDLLLLLACLCMMAEMDEHPLLLW